MDKRIATKVSITLWGMAAGLSPLIGMGAPAVAQDSSGCYVQSSDGELFDLSFLCGQSTSLEQHNDMAGALQTSPPTSAVRSSSGPVNASGTPQRTVRPASNLAPNEFDWFRLQDLFNNN